MTQDIFSPDDAIDRVREALRDLLDEVPAEVRASLFQRVAFLADEGRAEERERCAAICRRRADLWRKTTLAQSGMPAAREEARARANEAVYLADLLASGLDAEPDSDTADA